jgi:hypothetical protein
MSSLVDVSVARTTGADQRFPRKVVRAVTERTSMNARDRTRPHQTGAG